MRIFDNGPLLHCCWPSEKVGILKKIIWMLFCVGCYFWFLGFGSWPYKIVWKLIDLDNEITKISKEMAVLSKVWWRHQMETGHWCREFTGEFPTQRPVTLSFDVLFDLRLNKRFSKADDLRHHRAHYDVTVMGNTQINIIYNRERISLSKNNDYYCTGKEDFCTWLSHAYIFEIIANMTWYRMQGA